ncbi:hypothetical protein ACWIBQ_00880 [Microbacterium keratanolyticum]
MTFSLLGAGFVAVGLIAWLSSKRVFTFVLAVSAVFVTSAGVTIGESSVPPFYLLAVLATASAVWDRLRGHTVRHSSLKMLGWFVTWSLLVTATSPTFFRGIAVLDPRNGIDNEVYEPTPLDYTASMGAQAMYLVLAAGVVLYLAQRDDTPPSLLAVPFFAGNALSVVRLSPEAAPWIDSTFRNYASAGYNPFESRHFGIFAEPSYLAVFAIAALVYSLYRLRLARGIEKVTTALILIMSVVNLMRASSGTAALAVVALSLIAVAWYGGRFLLRRAKLHLLAIITPIAIAILLVSQNPLSEALFDTIDEKSGSQSFQNRFTSDLFAMDLTWQTWGLGVGLGANRPSSLLTLTLSSVGIIGVALLIGVIVMAMKKASGIAAWLPVSASLFALLVSKAIAEPALSTPLMWIMLGLLVSVGSRVGVQGSDEREPNTRGRARGRGRLPKVHTDPVGD